MLIGFNPHPYMYTFKYHHCINMWIISLLAIPIKIFIKSSPLSSVLELHTYMYRLKSHASMVKLFEPKILEALFNNDGILQIPWIRPSDGWFARHSNFGSDKNLSKQMQLSKLILVNKQSTKWPKVRNLLWTSYQSKSI